MIYKSIRKADLNQSYDYNFGLLYFSLGKIHQEYRNYEKSLSYYVKCQEI